MKMHKKVTSKFVETMWIDKLWQNFLFIVSKIQNNRTYLMDGMLSGSSSFDPSNIDQHRVQTFEMVTFTSN